MNTIIEKVNINEENKEVFKKAAKILKEGGIVAFPTETVYGLGANALNECAVKKIFKAKGRPSDNPLIVHIANKKDLYDLVSEVPYKAEKLINNFWPGPLTLIFKKSDKVPDVITAGLDTVAVRMPAHNIAYNLINIAEIPIAAPSANTSGKPSPTKAEHVIYDLKGKVDMIIDGGFCEIGLESTVLDVSVDIPVILRPGAITKEMCKKVVGEVITDPAIACKESKNIKPKSPGMKYTHYSPKAEVIIISGVLNNVIFKIESIKEEKENQGYKVGIMATEQTKNSYTCKNVLSVGNRNKPDEIATNLFSTLREFDEIGVDIVLAESIEEQEIGFAVMNRLTKAAGYKIIEV